MSLKSAELFEQLAGQLAADVAEKVQMGLALTPELDYDNIAEKTMAALDMDDLASDVLDRLDYTDIASNLDMGDLAREVSDELDYADVANNLDTGDIASTICSEHGDMLAADVWERLKQGGDMMSTVIDIVEDRVYSMRDPLDPETRLTVLATNVADRLKQSDDMRDMFAEVSRQLVRREVRALFVDLVKMMTSPEQWRGLPAQEGPVDLGEIRLEPVTAT
jgi:hypothetical protein